MPTDARATPSIPVLGGEKPEYLLASLRAYASSTRESAVMGNAAATLLDEKMSTLATHFAALPGFGATLPAGAAAGRPLVERAVPARNFPPATRLHRDNVGSEAVLQRRDVRQACDAVQPTP